MWRATFKSLFARKVRLGLTALSIVLGIGFVAGSYVLTDTMGAAFDQLFKTAATGTDVVVRSSIAFDSGPGRGGGQSQRAPVPASLTESVRAVPGVASVTGSVNGYAQMIDPSTGKAIGGAGLRPSASTGTTRIRASSCGRDTPPPAPLRSRSMLRRPPNTT